MASYWREIGGSVFHEGLFTNLIARQIEEDRLWPYGTSTKA